MPQGPTTPSQLISDAPVRRLLLRLEQEAELYAQRGPGSMVANIAAAWVSELRQALEQAAREDVVVPLSELAQSTGRSERTMRRWAEAGRLPGASRRGRRWVVSTAAVRGAA